LDEQGQYAINNSKESKETCCALDRLPTNQTVNDGEGTQELDMIFTTVCSTISCVRPRQSQNKQEDTMAKGWQQVK
jgi:hypothetical protein